MSGFDKKSNAKFILDVVNQDLLDVAVVWIGDNLEPEDVFSQRQLEDWAFADGFRKFE
jgi:hypothetical protein